VVAKAIVSSRFSRRRDVPDRWNAGLADVKVLANVRFAPEAASFGQNIQSPKLLNPAKTMNVRVKI
jgi:hypothetical protein